MLNGNLGFAYLQVIYYSAILKRFEKKQFHCNIGVKDEAKKRRRKKYSDHSPCRPR